MATAKKVPTKSAAPATKTAAALKKTLPSAKKAAVDKDLATKSVFTPEQDPSTSIDAPASKKKAVTAVKKAVVLDSKKKEVLSEATVAVTATTYPAATSVKKVVVNQESKTASVKKAPFPAKKIETKSAETKIFESAKTSVSAKTILSPQAAWPFPTGKKP